MPRLTRALFCASTVLYAATVVALVVYFLTGRGFLYPTIFATMGYVSMFVLAMLHPLLSTAQKCGVFLLGAALDGPRMWPALQACMPPPFAHCIGLGFGVAAVCMLLVQSLRQGGRHLALVWWLMLIQVFLVSSMAYVSGLSVLEATYDREFHGFDVSLGVYFPSLVAWWFARFPALEAISYVVYGTLPAALILSYVWQLRRPRPAGSHILAAFMLAGAAAALYAVVPACGPRQTFGPLFPDAVPLENYAAYTSHLAPELYRNAMPSLHMTWALLLSVQACCWYGPWSKWFFALFALLTGLATLGSGEHYLVDLVVAVPLTMAVFALASHGVAWRQRQRWQAIAAGWGLVAAWLVFLLRAEAWFAPVLSWTLTGATLAACGWLTTRLCVALRRAAPPPVTPGP